jgi:hypothetical protein
MTINEFRNKLEMESVRKESEDALKLLYEETERMDIFIIVFTEKQNIKILSVKLAVPLQKII